MGLPAEELVPSTGGSFQFFLLLLMRWKGWHRILTSVFARRSGISPVKKANAI